MVFSGEYYMYAYLSILLFFIIRLYTSFSPDKKKVHSLNGQLSR